MVTLNIVAMAAGLGAARVAALPRQQQVAITLEVGIQNGALAFGLALAVTGDYTLLPPIIVYSLLVNLTGLVVVVVGRRASARRQ